MAGLLGGLRRVGIDSSRADVVIGTSAGSVVGSVLLTTGDFERLAVPPSVNPPATQALTDPARMAEVFATFRAPGLDPVEARRRVGEFALAAQAGDPDDHIARIRTLIGDIDWPERDLVVTAVDAATGELRLWDRFSGVPLVDAIASSTAVPGVTAPIPINGRRFIDGGMRSATNADLATGADTVVIVEPLAHIFPSGPFDGALETATVIAIAPDAASIAAIGQDLYDRNARKPAYDAGARQAADAAVTLGAARKLHDS
jgi:NTE family protein